MFGGRGEKDDGRMMKKRARMKSCTEVREQVEIEHCCALVAGSGTATLN